MGEGFGANPIFSLSNFCLKHADKPEFEDRFACRWREQQAAPLRWGEYEHTDNPYIYPSLFQSFLECRTFFSKKVLRPRLPYKPEYKNRTGLRTVFDVS